VGIAMVSTILGGGGFGHDESAYVLKARSWLQGTPDTGWNIHRAPFISSLAMPIVAFTDNEVVVRLVGSVLSIAALVGVVLVARRMGGLWPALIAGAAVGTSLPYLRRGAEYLTDVPAAGVLLLIVAVVLTVVVRPDESGRLVIWLGPLIALAFYVRYQSALSVVAVAAGAAVVWPGAVKRLRRPLLIAAGIAVAAVVPHLIWATGATGSPLGVILATEEAGAGRYVGEGLIDYARMLPKDLAGPVGALLMAAGLLWIGWTLVTGLRGRTDDARLAGFVAIVVTLVVLPLGLVAHAEPRFVFFPVWLLIAIGAHAVVRLVSRFGSRQQVAVVAAASIVWIPLFVETAGRADRNAEARAAGFQIVVDAARYIDMDAPGSCGVLTSYQPQVTWYSGCFTDGFADEPAAENVAGLEGDSRYVLVFENGKRQPGPDRLENYLMLGPATEIDSPDDSIGDATVVVVGEEVEP
jgi:4-amino-4-deoxy-L-arabinose transferase-like glycosyltransferase